MDPSKQAVYSTAMTGARRLLPEHGPCSCSHRARRAVALASMLSFIAIGCESFALRAVASATHSSRHRPRRKRSLYVERKVAAQANEMLDETVRFRTSAKLPIFNPGRGTVHRWCDGFGRAQHHTLSSPVSVHRDVSRDASYRVAVVAVNELSCCEGQLNVYVCHQRLLRAWGARADEIGRVLSDPSSTHAGHVRYSASLDCLLG